MKSPCGERPGSTPPSSFAAAVDRLTRRKVPPAAVLGDEVGIASYAELPACFAALDEFFRARDVDAGHRLALECPPSVAGAVTLLYLLRRGFTFLLAPPIGPRYPLPAGATRTPAFCRRRLTLTATDGDGDDVHRHPEKFLRIEENAEWSCGLPGVDRGRPRLYLRTSGSTASPKIAVHSHQRLLDNALNCVRRFALRAADRIAIPVPLFHMYGLGAGFLPGFLAGAALDLQDDVNILTYLERERRFEPTVALLTPALCRTFVTLRRSPRRYRLVVTAGDRLAEGIVPAFESRFGTLINLYGSTELGAIATTLPTTPAAERGTSVGTLLPGVEARVAAAGIDDRDEEVGELSCRHRHGFEGYVDSNGQPWNERDDARLDADGWFRTGDLAKTSADGMLEILGRFDLSVNRDGLLVPFGDVEAAVARLDVAEQVAVAARGESRRGRRMVAFCVLGRGRSATAEQIRGRCRSALPGYLVPDEIVIVDALPTLPNGKMDRRNLWHAASPGGETAAATTQEKNSNAAQ